VRGIVNWFDQNSITMINGLARAMVLFMLAAGLSLIFGLMNVLNLAHGAIFLWGAYFGVTIGTHGNLLFAALAVAVVAGVLMGTSLMAAVRPVARRGYADQALLTIGISLILADLTQGIWSPRLRATGAPTSLGGTASILGQPYPVYRLAVIGLGLAVAVGLYFLFERTDYGARIRAAVADRDMVGALGVNVNRLMLSVMVLGTVLAAIAGVVASPIFTVAPGLDQAVLALALIVLTVGGFGSIIGPFLAAVLVGQAEALGVVFLPAGFDTFLLFGTMALVLVLRPGGLVRRA
jgi:branched-chain amino acid transport system permease protein